MKSTLLCLFLSVTSVIAQNQALRDQLRDALYTEEVSRKPAAAADQYQAILTQYADQRALAATALFRLAEIRHKQDQKAEATALYQRFLKEFGEVEPEAKLAREKLAILGAPMPEATTAPSVVDDETREIQRLQSLLQTAPDLVRDPKTLTNAINNGWTKAVEFLLKNGANPQAPGLLSTAAKKGYLNICQLLLQAGKPTPEEAGAALAAAIQNKRSAIRDYLLDHGVDANSVVTEQDEKFPNRKFSSSPLHTAAACGDLQSVKALLDHGADIHAMVQSRDNNPFPTYNNSFGTPLHTAVRFGNLALVQLLLDRGAKIDLPSPVIGLTPLHMAIWRASWNDDQDHTKIPRLLLERGANPNLSTISQMPSPQQLLDYDTNRLLDATALSLAMLSTSEEMVKLLLEHHADPNWRNANHVPLLELPRDSSLPSSHVPDEMKLKYADLLIAHGLQATSEWKDSRFSFASYDLRKKLVRHFLYPEWAQKKSVLDSKYFDEPPVVLAASKGNDAPPALAKILLELRMIPLGVTLFRLGEKQSVQEIPIDLLADAPLPELHWGDILEVQYGGETDYAKRNQIKWMLRKPVKIPITFEWGGQTRNLTLRGDRLTFDPMSDEVPLLSAVKLARLLCNIPDTYLQPNRPMPPSVIVKRDGWGEIPLPYFPAGSNNGYASRGESNEFRLQAGDHLSIKNPPGFDEELSRMRKDQVRVEITGTGVSWFFPASDLCPSLVQALTHCFAANLADTQKNSDPSAFSELLNSVLDNPPTVLAHPDFSKIRIRRLGADGKETVLAVDLSAAIKQCTDGTSAEDARKADVQLQAGDIVELDLTSSLKAPWHGFSAPQARFFHKVLSGIIQLHPEGMTPTQMQLDWQPPDGKETEAGWIPCLPSSGVPTTKVCDVLASFQPILNSIGRGGVTISVGHNRLIAVYLRDGDQVFFRDDSPPPLRRPRVALPQAIPQPGAPGQPSSPPSR